MGAPPGLPNADPSTNTAPAVPSGAPGAAGLAAPPATSASSSTDRLASSPGATSSCRTASSALDSTWAGQGRAGQCRQQACHSIIPGRPHRVTRDRGRGCGKCELGVQMHVNVLWDMSISGRRTSRPGQLSAFISRVAKGEYHSGEYGAQSHELCLPAAGAEDGHVNNAGKTKFRARRLGVCFFVWCKLWDREESASRCTHACGVWQLARLVARPGTPSLTRLSESMAQNSASASVPESASTKGKGQAGRE